MKMKILKKNDDAEEKETIFFFLFPNAFLET